tara:strand:+ start:5797 stop:6030 length:234 start_codon:yes stop_codon:yes gene_type:complete
MEVNYVIINKEDLDLVDFEMVIEDSVDSLRYSLDGKKTILKFKGITPEFLQGKEIYNLDKIIEIIGNSDNGWINNEN